MEKLIKYLLPTIFLVLMQNCNSRVNKCDVDGYVSSKFNESFEIIQGFENGEPKGVSNYLDAVSFLMKFSGHKTQMKIDAAIGYGIDTLEYKEDLSKWKLWYSKNKCLLTKQKVDSILSIIDNR